MLKTWTDIHYKLDESDWLYIAKHDREGSASLVCPGYSRDGQGFSIHFTCAHIDMLEQLVEVLRAVKTEGAVDGKDPTPEYPQTVAIAEERFNSNSSTHYEYSERQEVKSDRPLIYPVGREK